MSALAEKSGIRPTFGLQWNNMINHQRCEVKKGNPNASWKEHMENKCHQKVFEIRCAKPRLPAPLLNSTLKSTNDWSGKQKMEQITWFSHQFIAVGLLPVDSPPTHAPMGKMTHPPRKKTVESRWYPIVCWWNVQDLMIDHPSSFTWHHAWTNQ